AFDLLVERKFPSQQGRGIRFCLILGEIGCNPLCFPICSLEQPHLPMPGLAPIGQMSVIVGDAHLPVINSAAFKGGPAVLHLDGRLRSLLAAVPKQFPFCKIRFGLSHADFVAGLEHASFWVHQFPAQPRFSHVDPHRIYFVFAAQIFHRERRITNRFDRTGQHDCSSPRCPSALPHHRLPPCALTPPRPVTVYALSARRGGTNSGMRFYYPVGEVETTNGGEEFENGTVRKRTGAGEAARGRELFCVHVRHFLAGRAGSGGAKTVARGTRATVLAPRSEEHTSELQSRGHLVCRPPLEKKKLVTISPP